MSAPRLLAVAVSTVLMLPFAWALPVTGALDDAGSGQDAGGSPSEALPLAYGSYSANLTPMDADWFVFPWASGPSCLRAEVVSSHAMGVSLSTGDTSLAGTLTDGAFSTVLAIAPGEVRLGAVPDQAPWDVLSAGPYGFSVDVAPPAAPADARGWDAPERLATARVLPADCVSGVFQHDGVDVDAFVLNVSEPSALTVSLATAEPTAAVSVRDAAGASLATIGSGDAAVVDLAGAGVYYLVATGEGEDTVYALAALVGPPDPGQGCRPACL